MSELVVGEGFGSIGAAIAAAAAGDTVVVPAGTYREALIVDKPDLVIRAATGTRPVIDNGYGPHLFGAAGYTTATGAAIKARELPALTEANARRGGWVYSGRLNSRGYGAAVKFTAPGGSLLGFDIRNVPGRAIIVDADGVTVKDCRADFAYGGSVGVGTGVADVLFEDVVVTRGSMKWFDPTREGAGPGRVQTVVIAGGKMVTFRRCIAAYNYAEAFSADKESEGVTFEGCVSHDNLHWFMGLNFAQGARFIGCVAYACDNLVDVFDKENPADLFVAGSERADVRPAEGEINEFEMRGCVLVGGKRSFLIGGPSRPIQFVNSMVAGNTIVGRVTPGTQRPVFTWSVMQGRPHKETNVIDNVIVTEPGNELFSYQAGGDVLWAENVYGATAPAGMMGPECVVVDGAAVLANPFAPILGTFDPYAVEMPDVATTFNLDNYRPLAGSPADGRGALLPAVVVPPPVEPPDEPEPEPDWGALVGLMEVQRNLLESIGTAAGAALVGIEEIMAELAGMEGGEE